MKVEWYGYQGIKKRWFSKWYTGFCGIQILKKNFLGFNIYNKEIVVDNQSMRCKTSSGIWIWIFFYNLCIEFKDPWEGE